MAQALALAQPISREYFERDRHNLCSPDKLEGLLKNWYMWDAGKKNKLAPLKLYMHFKRHEFGEMLDTISDMDEGELTNLARSYVKKADSPKFYSAFYSLIEAFKKILGKETEKELLEKRLETEMNMAYFSYSYIIDDKERSVISNFNPIRKKRLGDLKYREKFYIIGEREKGIDASDLVRRCNLKGREVVYQVMTGYHRERGLIKKSDKKTFGKISAEEAEEISRLNKEGALAAEEIAKIYGLSGRHVVYLANKWIKGREFRTKIDENVEESENRAYNYAFKDYGMAAAAG
jgi:hypothetical protein